jgi:hypothetical protein
MLLGFFLFFFDLDHFASLIVTAARADNMRQAHGTAVRAGDKVASHNGIVGAAAIATAFRVFTFGLRGHSVLLIDMQPPGKARRNFQTAAGL